MADGFKLLVPAGGRGTRLWPITHTRPKWEVPLAGKPLLDWVVEPYAELGVSEIIIVLPPDQTPPQAVLGLKVTPVIQEEPLGLGHAVLAAKETVGAGPLVVNLSDTLCRAKLLPGKDFLVLHPVDDPSSYGVAVIQGSRVQRVTEKPKGAVSGLALVGVYGFSDATHLFSALEEIVAEGVRTAGEIQLTDGLARMLQTGWEPLGVEGVNWLDCGSLEGLLNANSRLLSTGSAVAKDALIDSESTHEGCTVLTGARVTRSRIVNCIVLENAEVTECNLHDSVVCERAILRGVRGSVAVGADGRVEGEG